MPKSYCGFPHSLCGSTRTQRLEPPSLPPTSEVTLACQHCSDRYEISAHHFKFETLISPPSNNILPAPISTTDKFTGLSCLLLLTHSWTFNPPHTFLLCSTSPDIQLCPSPGPSLQLFFTGQLMHEAAWL